MAALTKAQNENILPENTMPFLSALIESVDIELHDVLVLMQKTKYKESTHLTDLIDHLECVNFFNFERFFSTFKTGMNTDDRYIFQHDEIIYIFVKLEIGYKARKIRAL